MKSKKYIYGSDYLENIALYILCFPLCIGNLMAQEGSIPYLGSSMKPNILKGETILDLVVEEKSIIATNTFILYQNDPNPFYEETIIAFNLLAASEIKLTIHDKTGKVLKEEQGFFEKGKNYIKVNGNDLKKYGILYYQMTTPTQILSKKMIYRKA